MPTDSRLVNEQAKIQAENMTSEPQKQDTEMVHEFRIKNGNIEYQNLTDDYWNILYTDIQDLLDVDISDNVIENRNLVFADDVHKELKKLQNKLKQVYDSKIEMYQLSYKTNSDGSSELYIPLETKFTDDITICKVFDQDDEFVASNIKDSDFPLHKLDTKPLYIDNIPKHTSRVSVYSKQEYNSFPEFYSENTQPYAKDKKDLLKHTFSVFLIYSTLCFSFIYLNSTITTFLFAFFSIFYLAPFIQPIFVVLLSSLFILTYIEYKFKNYTNQKHEFDI